MDQLSQTEQTAEGHCPMCGGAPRGTAYPYATQWNGRVFDYLSCGSCRTTFVSPLPGAEDFAKMYSRASYHDEYYVEVCDEAHDTTLAQAAPMLARDAPMLDFGCGNGSFIRAARSAGFDCEGVELEASARDYASRNSGAPVHALEDLLASGRRFATIHLGDVLEHLPDPTTTMRTLERLLAPGGRFFIEGPLEDNASPVFYASRLFGFAKKKLKGQAAGDFPPYHLFRVTARNQRRYFERLGYRIMRFDVFETGWPYAGDGSRTTGNAVRTAIAAQARAAAGVGNRIGLRLGNRFSAVLAPPA